MKDFIQQYKNAKKAIEQLRAGEWVAYIHSGDTSPNTLRREGLKLWVANGCFFCEIVDESNNDLGYFGYFWKHYVWLAAARKIVRAYRKPVAPVPIL